MILVKALTFWLQNSESLHSLRGHRWWVAIISYSRLCKFARGYCRPLRWHKLIAGVNHALATHTHTHTTPALSPWIFKQVYIPHCYTFVCNIIACLQLYLNYTFLSKDLQRWTAFIYIFSTFQAHFCPPRTDNIEHNQKTHLHVHLMPFSLWGYWGHRSDGVYPH